VGATSEDKNLFDREDIFKSLDKITPINFREEISSNGVRFVAFNAGHVIGAAMFLIEICGIKILYTGDYSRERDLHIRRAEIPQTKVDVLIVESTYGTKTHDPRDRREKIFLDMVEKVVRQGGKCLLPVFVMGRAQELLLLLERHWASNPDLHRIRVFYASTLMSKCMTIFKTYVNMMGGIIREDLRYGRNPFDFRHISVLKNSESRIDNRNEPMVVMASPGMLQKGLSRSLFLKWCSDKRNGVVFTGYCVENTFARDILNGQRKIRRENGPELIVDCSVDYISFSAHADYRETREFIEKVNPSNVVLVHGEKHEAFRLKKELEKNFGSSIRFNAPFNWQTLKLSFPVTPKIKISESLVPKMTEEDLEEPLNDFSEFGNEVKEEEFTAVLIKRNFKYYLLKRKEVEKALGDIFGSLEQRIYVQNHLCIGDLYIIICQIFDNVSLKGEKNEEIIYVENGRVRVRKESENCLLVSWMSSFENDTIGDCLAFMLNSIGEFEKDLLQPFVKSGSEHVCSKDD
jgi:cleavage and polyadenylation specificity factor subunit 3